MTIKRPNYSTGQLLTAEDFQGEQDYHRNYRLWHNRALHTPGVGDGLEFSGSADRTKAMISPGYAINADGQELVVTKPVTFDVSNSAFGTRLAVVLRYAEIPPDPADDRQIAGAAVSTRTSERTTIELVPAKYNNGGGDVEYVMPQLLGSEVCIGVIRCSMGTLLGDPGSFDLTYRQRAGSRFGSPIQLDDNVVIKGELTIYGNQTVYGGKGGYVVDHFVNRIGASVELGDVLVIGADQPAFHYGLRNNIPVPEIDLASNAYDSRICGIVYQVIGELPDSGSSSQAGEQTAPPGESYEAVNATADMRRFTETEIAERGHAEIKHGQVGLMVTLGAFAHCKVDADIAPIVAGDLLTTSPTPGHAQKVLDRSQAIGAIVGKALAPLNAGKGRIPVMVMMQ
jgi:hypothetical protein